MAKAHGGKVTFLKVDIEQHEDIAKQYDVTGIPIVVYLNKGGIAGDPIVGAQPEKNYQAALDNLLN